MDETVRQDIKSIVFGERCISAEEPITAVDQMLWVSPDCRSNWLICVP